MDPLFVGLLYAHGQDTLKRLLADIPRYDQLVAWGEQNVADIEAEFSRFLAEYRKLEELGPITTDDQALRHQCEKDVEDTRATLSAMCTLREKHRKTVVEHQRLLAYLADILIGAPQGGLQ